MENEWKQSMCNNWEFRMEPVTNENHVLSKVGVLTFTCVVELKSACEAEDERLVG